MNFVSSLRTKPLQYHSVNFDISADSTLESRLLLNSLFLGVPVTCGLFCLQINYSCIDNHQLATLPTNLYVPFPPQSEQCTIWQHLIPPHPHFKNLCEGRGEAKHSFIFREYKNPGLVILANDDSFSFLFTEKIFHQNVI